MKFHFEIVCPFCGAIHYVCNVDSADFEAWKEGGLIQNCMPYLSATEREQMISHLCPLCQKQIFEEED